MFLHKYKCHRCSPKNENVTNVSPTNENFTNVSTRNENVNVTTVSP